MSGEVSNHASRNKGVAYLLRLALRKAATALQLFGSGHHAQASGHAPITTAANVVSVTVTPKVTGKYTILGATYGSPSAANMNVATAEIWDGTAIVGGGLATPMAGVTATTPTTAIVGCAVPVMTTGAPYPLKVPVTFSVRVIASGGAGGYVDAFSTILVTEDAHA